MDLLSRNISKKLNKLLSFFPVVVILGVRQCGKSTLSIMGREEWSYFDLENLNHLERITSDPHLFFEENSHHVVIDEAQHFPDLFKVIRGVVDADKNKKGRFILTGSASFELMKNISESLAGRVGIIELSPFKINEASGLPLSDFFNIFSNDLEKANLTSLKNLKAIKSISEIKQAILTGGYPEVSQKNSSEFSKLWMENYFSTYVNRDMRALFPKMDILKYQRVIRMLSALSGTIINKSQVGRSAEVKEKTVRDYLQVINGTFFWREIPAFKTPKIKNTLSSPKGHYRDSGLLLYLQNIDSQEKLSYYPKLGNVFESFVTEEVIRGLECTEATNINYYHYRTKAGNEVDLILEGSFGLLPIEIKFSSNTKPSDVSALTDFIKRHNLEYGVVINNCRQASMITPEIIQIPIGAI